MLHVCDLIWRLMTCISNIMRSHLNSEQTQTHSKIYPFHFAISITFTCFFSFWFQLITSLSEFLHTIRQMLLAFPLRPVCVSDSLLNYERHRFGHLTIVPVHTAVHICMCIVPTRRANEPESYDAMQTYEEIGTSIWRNYRLEHVPDGAYCGGYSTKATRMLLCHTGFLAVLFFHIYASNCKSLYTKCVYGLDWIELSWVELSPFEISFPLSIQLIFHISNGIMMMMIRQINIFN